MKESFVDECGVVAVVGAQEAANLAYLSLYALQHRGQEACGIVSFERQGETYRVHDHRSFGLVADNFDRDTVERLLGDRALGHVRYSTQGGKSHQNIQPFIFRLPSVGPVAVAHNGNLTNSRNLRADLEESGSIFTSTSDSEVFMHLVAKSRRAQLEDRIWDAMVQTKGAYSLVFLSAEGIFATRDPFGFRPLVVGEADGCFITASETCALDLIGGTYLRDVEPGEIVKITPDGVESFKFFDRLPKPAPCSFEPIYFSRPDSRIGDASIYDLRKRMGRQLAIETSASTRDADMVISVPDSGTPLALGFAEESGIPYEIGLVRNHYVGRTFIEPTQSIRDFGVKIKLNPVPSSLAGKRVVVIDDSLVRGTTSKKIVRMLRQAGAKEIHFRVGSPPITHSCYYGVSTPDRESLLAAQESLAEICALLGADSLAYLSVEGLAAALDGGQTAKSHCFACFTGAYPEEIYRFVARQPTDALQQQLSVQLGDRDAELDVPNHQVALQHEKDTAHAP